jgi:hypothetical protein
MKHLKEGKISGDKDGQGAWEIDHSELSRVYKARESLQPVDQSNLAAADTSVNSHENSMLQVKLDAAIERIEQLEADKADWKQQAQNLARLQPPERSKKSFWGRLKGL